MVIDYLKEQIEANFGHEPTDDQQIAIHALAEFILSADAGKVFCLRGFAGTGKTTLLSAVVRTLEQLERPCVLMAPTGRAAKVFSLYSGHPAFTIHKRIYRQKSIDADSIFTLNFNMLHHVFFVVDEASMISMSSEHNSLLDDLISFVYSGGQQCHLILVGDTAQLPPVGEQESPALNEAVLRSYGLHVMQATLRQIVRQQEASGILWNATALRRIVDSRQGMDALPRIRFCGFADVHNVPGNELIETLSNCYARFGLDETIVICRSNKRANVYNMGIRNQILGREEELAGQDLVMIAKNNYRVAPSMSPQSEESEGASFLANGDIAVVERVRNERELYGFRFADCVLRLPDFDDCEVETTVLLDTLHAEAPALPPDRQELLFQRVMEDYADIPQKRERLKKIKEDPYYNALQIKYAYAVTCHKAQGGQWSHVFIDQGYMTDEMLGPDYFRWLYTALTRATETVYFVNWSERQTDNS